MTAWTEAKNKRRCILIDKEIDGVLTLDQPIELAALQTQMLEHRRRVAPLPIKETGLMLRELAAKHGIDFDRVADQQEELDLETGKGYGPE